jgi:hypothetical protein
MDAKRHTVDRPLQCMTYFLFIDNLRRNASGRQSCLILFLFLFLPCNCLLQHVEDYAMTFGLRILVELIKCVGT